MNSHWSLATGYGVAIACAIVAFRTNIYWYKSYVMGPLFGAIWPLWFVSGGFRLSLILKKRGFDWARWYDCIPLQIHVPGMASNAPPRDEIAVLPGYSDTPEGLRMLFKTLRKNRLRRID